MDLISISLGTVFLLMLFVSPTIIRYYKLKNRREKLFKEYAEIYKESFIKAVYSEESLPNNIINLEDYKDRVKKRNNEELL